MTHQQVPAALPPFASFATAAIHAGQAHDKETGAVILPIGLSTTFAQKSPGVNSGFEYSRSGNPTRNAFEANVAALEGGRFGLAYSSGLAATMNISQLFAPGDHIISFDDVYGGTNRLLSRVATPHSGLQVTFVDLTNEELLLQSFKPNTKLVWIESPTNPTLKLADIKKVSEIAHSKNVLVVVDNTFMSPYFQRPLSLGADIVVHSVTKYLNGHSDVVMGLIVTNDEKIHEQLRFLQNAIGAVPSPFDCFLAMRGTKTLHLRMREHQRNAFAVATFLESSPKVQKVLYPGLPSHPQHELAKRQMTGYGGMITFYLKGGLQESKAFLENLKLFALAESLGGVESLAEHPAIMTHASVPVDQRAKLGIHDNLVRLSVGVEDLNDLINDIQNALAAIP